MPQGEGRKLIAGPSAFICFDCVRYCNDIIADDVRWRRERDGAAVNEGTDPRQIPEPPNGSAVRCALCRTPVADGMSISNLGVLCFDCIRDIEAAIAARKQ
jgi:hypothetical protein